MSRVWKRSVGDCFCGYCVPRRTIHKGDPAIFITIPPGKREHVRCQDCAGEKAPEDLPELLESGIETSGFINIGRVAPKRTRGALKHAVKEWMPYRDPGEEG